MFKRNSKFQKILIYLTFFNFYFILDDILNE